MTGKSNIFNKTKGVLLKNEVPAHLAIA